MTCTHQRMRPTKVKATTDTMPLPIKLRICKKMYWWYGTQHPWKLSFGPHPQQVPVRITMSLSLLPTDTKHGKLLQQQCLEFADHDIHEKRPGRGVFRLMEQRKAAVAKCIETCFRKACHGWIHTRAGYDPIVYLVSPVFEFQTIERVPWLRVPVQKRGTIKLRHLNRSTVFEFDKIFSFANVQDTVTQFPPHYNPYGLQGVRLTLLLHLLQGAIDTYDPPDRYIRYFSIPQDEDKWLEWLQSITDDEIGIAIMGTKSGGGNRHVHVLFLNGSQRYRYDPAQDPFSSGGGELHGELNKLDNRMETAIGTRPTQSFAIGPQSLHVHDTLCVAWCCLFVVLTLFNPDKTPDEVAVKISDLKSADINFGRRFHTILECMVPDTVSSIALEQLFGQVEYAVPDYDSDSATDNAV